MDADGVQIFLTDPQSYKAPKPRPDADALLQQRRDGRRPRAVHAQRGLDQQPDPRPGRKLLAAARAGAPPRSGPSGMVVHGGHVLAEDDPAVGVDNWRKTFTYQAKDGGFPLPLFIENTAGGGNAMARDLDAIARLWDAIGEFGAGFVLDTCHAWAAGWDLATAVDDLRAITGRIDLVHLNNSRDPRGSSRDRHAPLADGEIPTELLSRSPARPTARSSSRPPATPRRTPRRSRCSGRRWRAERPRPDGSGAPRSAQRHPVRCAVQDAAGRVVDAGPLVRTTSPSGRRTSRTTSAISTSTAMSRRQHAEEEPLDPDPAVVDAEVVEHRQHPDQRLGRLPEQQRAPPRPGQHRQRQQPQRVLRAPHLVEQQEAGDQQERDLRRPGAAPAPPASASRPRRRSSSRTTATTALSTVGVWPAAERAVEEPVVAEVQRDVPDGLRVGRPAAG